MTATTADPTEVKALFAFTKAKYLSLFKPIVDQALGVSQIYAPATFFDGAFAIEPAEIGGIYIVATCGRTLAVLHDPDGKATAPMTLRIPDAAFAAAKGPAPIAMTFEGDSYKCPLPEWAQPGEAYFYDAGMHINTQMRNPDWAEEPDHFHPALFSVIAGDRKRIVATDYLATRGIKWDWRRVLRTGLEGPDTPRAPQFNPHFPAMFKPFQDHFDNPEKPRPSMQHRTKAHPNSDNPWMSIVQIDGHPEFIGAWCHMSHTDFPEPPAHFMQQPAAEEAKG